MSSCEPRLNVIIVIYVFTAEEPMFDTHGLDSFVKRVLQAGLGIVQYFHVEEVPIQILTYQVPQIIL